MIRTMIESVVFAVVSVGGFIACMWVNCPPY